MSRSYKKHYRAKQKNSKSNKKFANRKVRRNVCDLPKKGKAYKKKFESWDICDFNWIWTKEDAIKSYQGKYEQYRWFRKEFPTLEEYLKYWEKCVKRK